MEAAPVSVNGREPDWTDITVNSVTVGTSTTVLGIGVGKTGSSNHQYEGGTVTFQAIGGPYPVVDSTSGGPLVPETIEIGVVLTPAQIAALGTNPWGILKDDDPEQGLLPKFYAIDTGQITDSFIKTAYRDAYIDIRNLPNAHNPNRTVPFDLYIDYIFEIVGGIGWNNSKDLESDEDYWTSFVVAAYQRNDDIPEVSPPSFDGDPDIFVTNSTYPGGPFWSGEEYHEEATQGLTVGSGDWDTLIFRAVHFDYFLYSYPHNESQTIAYEIGHSAGNAGSAAEHHAEGGIMDATPQANDVRFTGKTIKRFREAIKW
jgi:hypothetical protein